MSIGQYDVGDKVRLSAIFTDTAAAAVDPGTVKLIIDRPPGGAQIVLLYGTDAALVKDSTGHYHADQAIDMAGDWQFRWVSTGNGAGAEEGFFVVRRQDVVEAV